MHVQTPQYSESTGFLAPSPAHLNSVVVGCSTAGEIVGTTLTITTISERN